MSKHATRSSTTCAFLGPLGAAFLCSAILLSVSPAFGALGIYESYVVLNLNSGGNVFYDAGASTGNPDYQNANLGTFNPVGNSIILNGGEVKTYKNGSSDIFGAYLAYRIWSGSASGSFTETSLPWNQDLTGGDQKWQATGAGINVLSGLGNGNYTLELYFRADGNDDDAYDNGGNPSYNYRASFTVVPEATNVAMAVFGITVAGWFVLRGLSRKRWRSDLG
jgi:hypothetical protein